MECIEIKEGNVKYQGRDDFKCNYSIVGDKQYYYLNDKVLNNNTRVASTNLKEAIDPLYASEAAENVGLLDSYGREVIPCTNKSIKPVNDDIVLVEPAHPISQSVIDAVALKKDPLAATKLVSTPALIKDKINSKMGNTGRYVFNNQFSEATLVDVNGNNLVNNEYYSFIAMNPEKVFFSKNTIDSVVGEYSILPPEVQSDVTPASDTNEIDVTNVEVPTEVVENALTNTEPAVGFDNTTVTPNVNEGFASTDVTPVSLEENQLVENTPVEEVAPINDNVQEVVEDGFVPPQISADDENVIDSEETPVENTEVVNEANPVEEVTSIENPVEEAGEVVNEVSPVDEVAPIETPVEEASEVVNEVSPVDEVVPIETPVEEASEVVNEVSPVEESAPIENPVEESGEEVEDVVEDENVDINEEYEDTTLDNMFGEVKDARDVEDDMKEDIFSESEVQTDSINFEDEFDDSYEENDYVEENNNKDTTMMEVAKSMAGLIKQNKELKTSNNDLVGKLERVNASRKNYVDKTKMLEEKVDILNTKNQSLDSKIIKLESRNEMLESKTHDQERVIESQRRELDNLRKQLEGKEELSRLLQDAKVMLEDNDASYDYEEDNYYRRAA